MLVCVGVTLATTVLKLKTLKYLDFRLKDFFRTSLGFLKDLLSLEIKIHTLNVHLPAKHVVSEPVCSEEVTSDY